MDLNTETSRISFSKWISRSVGFHIMIKFNSKLFKLSVLVQHRSKMYSVLCTVVLHNNQCKVQNNSSQVFTQFLSHFLLLAAWPSHFTWIHILNQYVGTLSRRLFAFVPNLIKWTQLICIHFWNVFLVISQRLIKGLLLTFKSCSFESLLIFP